jgi:peptidyl-prolyl cis-trans isomerase C
VKPSVTALLLAAASLGGAVALAQGERPVAKVGDGVVALSEARARLRQVPLFQLSTLGNTPDEIRHTFVQELVRMELWVQGARAEGLEQRSDVRERIMVRLKDALIDDVLNEVAKEEVSDQAVKEYYEKNRQLYAAQTRLKLWRIVVKTREEAEEILGIIKTDAEYQKDPLAGWEKLANERSIDRTTAMRRGDLGFVQPTGATAHRDVEVSPALFKAAMGVKDGEVVPTPLEDEGTWVVLLRRGSTITPERSFESEAPTIRNMLSKKRVQDRMKKLVADLRKKYVSEVNAMLLEQVEITRDGDVAPKNRPGTLPRKSHPAAASPQPQGWPGEYR